MRHALESDLEPLADLLDSLRHVPSLVEKKPGVFYRKGRAFLHTHADPLGLFIDVRLNADFERYRVNTKKERSDLLRRITAFLLAS